MENNNGQEKLAQKTAESGEMVVLWQDVVSLRDLIISIVIAVVLTMGLYALAPQDNHSLKLLFGLLGAVIAVIINSIVFKAKREIEVED